MNITCIEIINQLKRPYQVTKKGMDGVSVDFAKV